MRRKIIVVGSYAESLVNFRLQLMQAFMQQGYEVIALAPYDGEVERILKQHQIRFVAIPMQRNGTNPLKDLKLFLFLRQLFLVEQPHCVFAYTIKPVIYTSLAARSAKVPGIYSLITGTGYAFSNKNFKAKLVGGLARKLFKIALRSNTKVIFQNKDNVAIFEQAGLLAAHIPRAIVNGSGVDCDVFRSMPYPEKIAFLLISRFIYAKGICEYVAAARKVRAQYPEIRFYLVGWLDEHNPDAIGQEQLDAWIKEGIVEYLGRHEDVRGSIAQSSVYVLPSEAEGMPRTVLEAMAMARPIITTDVPGCRETVIPGKNGFLVPYKDVEALARAMEYFVLNPHEVKPMGAVSRQLAEEKFDVHKVNDSILEEMQIK